MSKNLAALSKAQYLVFLNHTPASLIFVANGKSALKEFLIDRDLEGYTILKTTPCKVTFYTEIEIT